MLAYAREQFEQQVRGRSGKPNAAHLRQAAKTLKLDEDAFIPHEHPFPGPVEFVWLAFVDLNTGRSAGMAPNALSWTDIWAWAQLNQVIFARWEIDTLKKLDAIWCEVASARYRGTNNRDQIGGRSASNAETPNTNKRK